jgi:hypothetical protein
MNYLTAVRLTKDLFRDLVVRVPGYRSEMCCVSCEVRTEFICYVGESRPPLWPSGQSSWLQNKDVLCFLWGMNWIYVMWSSGQSSWLLIQRSGFDSRRYQIFWEIVYLERAPLSLVSSTEELLERKSSGSGLENREYGRRGSAALTKRHLSIRKSRH